MLDLRTFNNTANKIIVLRNVAVVSHLGVAVPRSRAAPAAARCVDTDGCRNGRESPSSSPF